MGSLTIDSNPRFLAFPAQLAAKKAAFMIMETAYVMISFYFFLTVKFDPTIDKIGFKKTDEKHILLPMRNWIDDLIAKYFQVVGVVPFKRDKDRLYAFLTELSQ